MAAAEDFFEEAQEELKRVDHLIFVSLKYTRTIDVLKNILKRLITSFDCVIDGALEKARQEGKITDAPKAPVQKCRVLSDVYGVIFDEFINFYFLLRKLDRVEYDAVNEYRRHVAFIAHTEDEGDIEVNIDVATDYFRKAKFIISVVQEKLGHAAVV